MLGGLCVRPSKVDLELPEVKAGQVLLQGDEVRRLFLVDAAFEKEIVGVVSERDGVIQGVGSKDIADDGAVSAEDDLL